MGAFFFFFVALTLAEILFSAAYYYLVGKIDLALVTSAAIYIVTIVVAYIACRIEWYREKRQAMLDALCR